METPIRWDTQRLQVRKRNIDNYKPVKSRTNKNYEQEEDMSKKDSKRLVKEVLCKKTVCMHLKSWQIILAKLKIFIHT